MYTTIKKTLEARGMQVNREGFMELLEAYEGWAKEAYEQGNYLRAYELDLVVAGMQALEDEGAFAE